MKAWCVWCENGETQGVHGYFWIHRKCAEELMDYGYDVKAVKEILQGKHFRNKKQKDLSKIEIVLDFLKDMEEFRYKWNNTMKMILPAPQTKQGVDE